MATPSLSNGKKIKALWRSLAPLTFVAVCPLSVQWHLGVRLIKLPTPPTPKVRNAQAFRVEGGSEVSRAAEGVARDSEEVVPGGRVALLASLGVLSDLYKQTPTSETPTALQFYLGFKAKLEAYREFWGLSGHPWIKWSASKVISGWSIKYAAHGILCGPVSWGPRLWQPLWKQ